MAQQKPLKQRREAWIAGGAGKRGGEARRKEQPAKVMDYRVFKAQQAIKGMEMEPLPSGRSKKMKKVTP